MLEQLKSFYFFIAIAQIIIGCYFVLIGFKVINRFKNNPELEQKWYHKYQTTFKLGGFLLIILGCLSFPFLI
ncbi:hypothetical protein [Olleya sp. Bg11-27]|uniref:hypothetical protein n=1 Tax=Olleya sp. Bg11-27 TaxID=2058135 RepID=UPI000C316947|nr:hypothetical protein [Olleya sp. Bg11-27]AUC75612.1 hypothetical protein CW732_07980 [Olleya sp. Bg11-27]